jgi:hypothetical protein
VNTQKAICAVMVVAAVLALAGPASAQEESDLGTIQFRTSGSPGAQAHFIRGVAALHSFWYEEAAAIFRLAQEAAAACPVAEPAAGESPDRQREGLSPGTRDPLRRG